MKRILILQVLFTAFLGVNAQQVSVDVARSRAANFMQTVHANRAPAKGGQVSAATLELAYTSLRRADQKVCFYVFNKSEQNGFVIVGGDESADEILAYSDSGTFDYEKVPDNFKWWLSQYNEQISLAMDNADAQSKVARKVANSQKKDISPIVSTTWDQNDPYNSAIPSLGSSYTGNYALATGCVAVAMAQVMKCYNYPVYGTGSNSYSQTWDSKTITYSANFANTKYDWQNMTSTYSASSTAAQKSAVATLIYHCGVSINTQYGQIISGGSSASTKSAMTALNKYFKYNNAIRYEERAYCTNTEWEDIIYKQLADGHPVIYTGNSSSGTGHAFVCDGYSAENDTYHMNWGWGGNFNCYCRITGADAIKPGGSGTGGSGNDATYNNNQGAVINIIPTEGGLETPYVLESDMYKGSIKMTNNGSACPTYWHYHSSSKYLGLTDYIWNLSRSLSQFTLGVKATDTTTGYVYYFKDSQTVSLSSDGGIKSASINFDINELPYNGTYLIKMVVRNTSSTSEDDWYDVGVQNDVTLPTVTITGASDQPKVDVDMVIESNSVQVDRSIKITPSSLYTGSVTYSSSNSGVARVSSDGIVTGVSNGTATITAKAAGNTYFNATTCTFEVEVVDFVQENASAEISATGLVTGGSSSITLVSGYDGYATYSSSNTGVATVSSAGVVKAVAQGNATITVDMPDTKYFKGNTITFDILVSAPGVIFYKEPYFSHNNNPWIEDLDLHLPLYNGGSTTLSGEMKGRVHLGGRSCIITFEYPLSPGEYREPVFTELSVYKTKFKSDTPLTIEFYTDVDLTQPFNYSSITYTFRDPFSVTVSSGYSTLILPIDASIPSGMKVYSCSSEASNVLILTEVKSIKANTPYIIYKSGSAEISFTGPDIVDDVDRYTDGILTGLVKSASIPVGSYVISTKNGNLGFYKSDVATTGEANTCYITYPDSPSQGLYFDAATAISSVPAFVPSEIESIYAPNGTKVLELQKGLNIVKMHSGAVQKIMVK